MLPAAARLRRRADFVATVRRGRRRGHGVVVVHMRSADPGDATKVRTPARRDARDSTPETDVHLRVGFVVSRAVGGAVIRNRVRRRLQHLVRDRLETLPAGASMVVRALPAAASRSHAELAADLDAALLGVLASRRRGSRGGRRGSDDPAPAPSPAPRTRTNRTGSAVRNTPGSPSIAASALAAPIVAYRRWVSPALPARCRFQPTCSEYALEALRIHGALWGPVLAVRRLLRCHPFHPGGYDPVPPASRRRSRATVTGA